MGGNLWTLHLAMSFELSHPNLGLLRDTIFEKLDFIKTKSVRSGKDEPQTRRTCFRGTCLVKDWYPGHRKNSPDRQQESKAADSDGSRTSAWEAAPCGRRPQPLGRRKQSAASTRYTVTGVAKNFKWCQFWIFGETSSSLLTLHLKEKEKPQTPDYMKCLQGRGATGTLARAAGGCGETLRPCRAEADALPV